MRKPTTLQITQAAVVTAAYVLLTLPFAQFAFGPIQFRLAEAMTVLPVLFPAAVPGLFLGWLLSNLFNPNSLGPIDIVFGSLATLAAALATWRIARRTTGLAPAVRRILCLLPPVVIKRPCGRSYLPFLLMDPASSASPLSWCRSIY
jgi:uncharacterized membrane protein